MSLSHIPSRYFNKITYNAEHRTITKSSVHEQKLIHEIEWYLHLPKELKKYAPEIVSYSLEQGNVYVTLQYVPWPTVAELFMKSVNDATVWERIFSKLQEVFQTFAQFHGEISSDCLENMYIHKTRQRFDQFLQQNAFARSVHKKGYLTVNGRTVLCPLVMFEHHLEVIRTIFENRRIHLLHGDLCFSNALFDNSAGSLKLIDPRGSFGESGLFGDQRYDLAKVRHSLSGYEHIVTDAFTLQITGGKVDIRLHHTPFQRELSAAWDQVLGSGLREVKMIEALLFLSMLPLHQESSNRQMAMYALGAELLNDALQD